MAFGRKGGSSFARAQRARRGHKRRRARALPGGSTHYKGSPKRRTKPSWWG
jgi:hypothetical protein